ncbi:hypothetical protein HDU97_000827 [Phlyctochytrium planicorne]|nr:hypothetical protein HDU97_000827 [Phlyctochytrium planicorne]
MPNLNWTKEEVSIFNQSYKTDQETKDAILLTAAKEPKIDFKEVKRCLGNTRNIPDIKDRLKHLNKVLKEMPAQSSSGEEDMISQVPVQEKIRTFERKTRNASAAQKVKREMRGLMTPSRHAAMRARKVTDISTSGAFGESSRKGTVDKTMTPSRKEAIRAKRVTGAKDAIQNLELVLNGKSGNRAESSETSSSKPTMKTFAPKTPSRLRNLLEVSADVNIHKSPLWKDEKLFAKAPKLAVTDSGFEEKDLLALDSDVFDEDKENSNKGLFSSVVDSLSLQEPALESIVPARPVNSRSFLHREKAKPIFVAFDSEFTEKLISESSQSAKTQEPFSKDGQEERTEETHGVKVVFSEEAPTPPRAKQVIGKRSFAREMDEDEEDDLEANELVEKVHKRQRISDDSVVSDTAKKLATRVRAGNRNCKKLSVGSYSARRSRVVSTPVSNETVPFKTIIPDGSTSFAFTFEPSVEDKSSNVSVGHVGWLSSFVNAAGKRLGFLC